MPDINLKLIGLPEMWIELKAGTPFLDLRPPQYAWIMRRCACGGLVFGLNRHLRSGDSISSWRLYDLRKAAFEPKGRHMRVISPPDHTGFSIIHLESCLRSL